MSGKDVVDTFDKKVTSIWLVIGIGAAKSVEYAIQLINELWVEVVIAGVDVSMLALYMTLMLGGTTGLIAWKTYQND
jgi:hypothetical protein